MIFSRLIYILLLLSFLPFNSWARGGERRYFGLTGDCADDIRNAQSRGSYNPFTDGEDAICTFLFLPMSTADTVLVPTYFAMDVQGWLSELSSSKNKGPSSSENSTKLESLTTPTEKKAVEAEVPEERKLDKSRLSLLQASVDDAADYRITKQLTPLLMATFVQMEQFVVSSNLGADKFDLYAEALIRLNQMILEQQLNF